MMYSISTSITSAYRQVCDCNKSVWPERAQKPCEVRRTRRRLHQTLLQTSSCQRRSNRPLTRLQQCLDRWRIYVQPGRVYARCTRAVGSRRAADSETARERSPGRRYGIAWCHCHSISSSSSSSLSSSSPPSVASLLLRQFNFSFGFSFNFNFTFSCSAVNENAPILVVFVVIISRKFASFRQHQFSLSSSST